jgi:hypothetical protein
MASHCSVFPPVIAIESLVVLRTSGIPIQLLPSFSAMIDGLCGIKQQSKFCFSLVQPKFNNEIEAR